MKASNLSSLGANVTFVTFNDLEVFSESADRQEHNSAFIHRGTPTFQGSPFVQDFEIQ